MAQRSSNSDMNVNERLSAAIDNELSADECNELLDEFGVAPELRQAWERHHVVNALLRGEHVGSSNSTSWDAIRANLGRSRQRSSGISTIIDFLSLREQHLVKWVGGAALAASVVLGVSLFVATQQPGNAMQAQFAVESAHPIPPMSQMYTPEPIFTNEPDPQDDTLPVHQNPDVFLASDKDSDLASPTNQRQNRGVPPTNPPQREFVRLVSDK